MRARSLISTQASAIGPVGMIGLGNMGTAMSGRLKRVGYRVIGWDIDAAQLVRAAANGVEAAASPATIASQARLILTSLPGPDEVSAVAFGEQGIASGKPAGLTLVDTSTTSPAAARALARQLAAFGITFVDAPVSGGVTGAMSGKLSVMVGASQDDLEGVRPALEALGRITHCGDVGAGQVAKACNQLVAIVSHAVIAEMLILADRVGADPARVRRALLDGWASSRILEVQGDRMLRRDFEPGGKAIYHTKDFASIREMARAAGMDLVVFEAAATRMQELIDNGGGDLDDSAVFLAVERARVS